MSGVEQPTLSNYARKTRHADKVYCHETRHHGADGASAVTGWGWGGLIVLFIVVLIIVWLIIYFVNPEFFQDRDDDDNCNGHCNVGRAFVVALVIAIILVVIIGAVGWAMQ